MSAWAQTYSGRALDFDAPVVDREMILVDVARGLAATNRFCGATSLPYSVAQHSVVGAQCVLDETDDAELAAFFLLHDAHEAFFGDWTRPAQDSLVEEIDRTAEANGVGEMAREAMRIRVKRAIGAIKARLDRAILTAAGLSFARFEAEAERILAYDLRALKSERNDLMRRPPRAWATIEDLPRLKTRGVIKPWSWHVAEDRFREMFAQLCPDIEAPAHRHSKTA